MQTCKVQIPMEGAGAFCGPQGGNGGFGRDTAGQGRSPEVLGKDRRKGVNKNWSQGPLPLAWEGWVCEGWASSPLLFSCLFPLLLCPRPSLVQVRSSLGMNILSSMAAFAGTAILLMEFFVINWVCLQTSPAVGNVENGRAISRGWGRSSFAIPGPWHWQGLQIPLDPRAY